MDIATQAPPATSKWRRMPIPVCYNVYHQIVRPCGVKLTPSIERRSGVLVLDDTTLDKPYARPMERVSRHWSGKHHQVVQDINLVSLVWTIGPGAVRLPCDFRIYHKTPDGPTQNDHFRQRLTPADQHGFAPEMVLFDSW